MRKDKRLENDVLKRSVVIGGRRTSISMENDFWVAFKGICKAQGVSINQLIEQIDARRRTGNLSSAIRLYVLAWYQPSAMREAA